MKLVKEYTFTAELYSHGSWGQRDVGTFESTMSYYEGDDAGRGMIEWDIPDIEQTEEIGLTFEMRGDKRALIEYDGIMAIPFQACELLESLGIIVDEEFKS